jgi:signal peptidase I
MQCTSCRFENMPGVPVCGRCGARLDLGSGGIDVHPPRATVRAKRWRRWFPGSGPLYRARDSFLNSLPEIGRPVFDRPAREVVLRMVVPGWPQACLGHAGRGRLLFRLYLGTLLPGLLFVGSTFGSLLLGLALSVHISSVLDAVFTGCRDWAGRALYTTLCCLAVGTVVYYPIVWAATRVAIPMRIALDAPPFQAGDVIVYNPSAYRRATPQVGDVVIYDVPALRISGRTAYGNAIYDIRGLHIDRVVATAGQKVDIRGPKVLVDGKPAASLPLNIERLPGQLSVTVPAGRCLIVPSGNPVIPQGTAQADWQHLSLVPATSVRGKVYLRNQPLRRWWFVR